MLTNEKYKGDALLQKTYTLDFLSKIRAENDGDVIQHYVENSHPAIIDKDTWEAVQIKMERRRVYTEKHHIQKVDFVSDKNSLTGRVICGVCGRAFDRNVWNSTVERLRRVI